LELPDLEFNWLVNGVILEPMLFWIQFCTVRVISLFQGANDVQMP